MTSEGKCETQAMENIEKKLKQKGHYLWIP